MTSTMMEQPFIDSTIAYWADVPDTYYVGTVGQYRLKLNHQPVRVHDMRGMDCSLDKQGFQLVQHETSARDYTNPEHIKSTVYAESEEVIRRATGAARVHCFSHLVRTNPPEVAHAMAKDPTLPDAKPLGATVPAPSVHIDHSASGSLDILRDNLPNEASSIEQNGRRWAIINLWRPIRPIQRNPLAVCDAQTVAGKDLVDHLVYLPPTGAKTYENVSKGGSFGTVAVLANPSHKWYYVSAMQPHEALLLKIFDSKEHGVARGTPHTSFHIPGTENCETRNSIDVRCLVFYDD